MEDAKHREEMAHKELLEAQRDEERAEQSGASEQKRHALRAQKLPKARINKPMVTVPYESHLEPRPCALASLYKRMPLSGQVLGPSPALQSQQAVQVLRLAEGVHLEVRFLKVEFELKERRRNYCRCRGQQQRSRREVYTGES